MVVLHPPTLPNRVVVSRWDLLHLVYSAENPPRCARDLADLQGVLRRVIAALGNDSFPP